MVVFAQKPLEISGPFPAQLRMELDSLPERMHSDTIWEYLRVSMAHL
jgi:hypothetical protein